MQCAKKQESDVLHDRLTTHYLRCDRGVVECCESINATGEELDCSDASRVSGRPSITYTPPGSLSPGGWAPPPRPGRPGQYGGSGSAYPVAPPPPGHHRQPITGIRAPNAGLKLPGSGGGGGSGVILRH